MASKKRDQEQKALSSGGEKLMTAQAQLDKWKAQAEEAEQQKRQAAAALAQLRDTHGAQAEQASAELTSLQRQLAEARVEAEMTDGQVSLANDLDKEVATLEAEMATLETELEQQRAILAEEQRELSATHAQARDCTDRTMHRRTHPRAAPTARCTGTHTLAETSLLRRRASSASSPACV